MCCGTWTSLEVMSTLNLNSLMRIGDLTPLGCVPAPIRWIWSSCTLWLVKNFPCAFSSSMKAKAKCLDNCNGYSVSKACRKFQAFSIFCVHHAPRQMPMRIVAFRLQVRSREIHEEGRALPPSTSIHARMDVLKSALFRQAFEGICLPHQRSSSGFHK